MFEAVENSRIAENNYIKGKDIKFNRVEAKRILDVVYWNKAAAYREIYGRKIEISFAQDKGLEMMPTKIEEIKEIIPGGDKK